MEIRFKIWLEDKNIVKNAILGTISGADSLSTGEEKHYMARNTTDYSSKIRSELKNLGIVKSVVGKSRRIKILNLIDDGMSIEYLIKLVNNGTLEESRYVSDLDDFARNADIELNMRTQESNKFKNTKDYVNFLISLGYEKDEIRNLVNSKFGPVDIENLF